MAMMAMTTNSSINVKPRELPPRHPPRFESFRFIPVFAFRIAQVTSQKVRAWPLIDRLFETEYALGGPGGIPYYGDGQKPPVDLPFSTKRANIGA
jgi:hypothetical protein